MKRKESARPLIPRCHYGILFLLIGVIFLTPGCVQTPPAAERPWEIPSDKYVFIDHHVSRSGDALNGSCGGGMMIDFPTYAFDKSTGGLSGIGTRRLEVNDSLRIVFGDGISLGGELGGGASTYLTPVYTLPFEKNGIIIREVTPGGSATILAANETLSLPAGGSWTNTTVVTGFQEFPGSEGPCAIRITRIETVFNAGIADKKKIFGA